MPGTPTAAELAASRARRTKWIKDARFGLFVHWGLYSVAARHEWVKSRERLDDATYRRYFEHFNPDLYDPREWARAAKRAGMRYAVITTKHHEGFCLFETKLTEYKASRTRAGRDLVRPFVDAMRAEGLRVGFYYSLIDWAHPDFTIDGYHPLRDRTDVDELNVPRQIERYAAYLHGQIEELLTEYGTIDYLFLDFSYPAVTQGGKGREAWQSDRLVELIYKLQPDIVINDRLDLPASADVLTPEQYQPATAPRVPDGGLWEACQTLNGSWGYDRDNTDWKTTDQVIRLLVDGVAKDGNLLLNIGPTPRGTIDETSWSILEGLGEWMSVHSDAIYGAGSSRFVPPPDCRYTQRGRHLYLHIFSWPFRHLHLAGLVDQVEFVRYLHDGSEVRWTVIPTDQQAQNTTLGPPGEDVLTLELPTRKPSVSVPVIDIILREASSEPRL